MEIPILVILKPIEAESVVLQLLQTEFGWQGTLAHADIHLLNQADEAPSIENVRHLLAQSAYPPYQSMWQYYILFGVDQASAPAQNALLKVLEEPPKQTRLILTAEQPSTVLPTLLSRLQVVHPGAGEPDSSSEIDLAYWGDLSSQSYSQLIEKAGEYSDRDQAISLLSSVSESFHHLLKTKPELATKASFITQQQILLQSRSLLEKNVNVKLVLEACFFQLKNPQTYLPFSNLPS